MSRPRIVPVLLACLLVTAGVAGPAAQPAVAAEAGECTALDDFIMFATLGAVNTDTCGREAYVQDAIADYQETTAEQTHVDMYAEGQSVSQGADNYNAVFDNYLNDTETVAWSKMEVAVAEAYQNGSTEAQARYEAQKAINEYYAVKQRNLIAQYNNHITTIERIQEQAASEANLSRYGTMRSVTGATGKDYVSDESHYINLTDTTITLANGTSVHAELIEVRELDTDNVAQDHTLAQASGSTYRLDVVWVLAPNSNYEDTTVYDHDSYHAKWDRINNKRQSVISEAENYVNATYADYSSGTINASDVISARTAMFEYGTTAATTNQSLYESIGALATMGFDTPSLNGTGTMDVTHQNQTYTGLVMARNAPGGSWSVNTTYDPSNITGPVFMVTTDGKKIDFTSNFTVEAIRSESGSDLSSVNTTEYAYKTADASDTANLTDELMALSSELDDRQASGGAGGGSGGNSILVVIAVAAAALVALGRNGGGGQGRRY